jgi:uncharacterized membrane protein
MFIVLAIKQLARITRWVAKHLKNRAQFVGVTASIGIAGLLVGYLFYSFTTFGLSVWLEKKNNLTDPNTSQPTSALRSGSPDSLVPWEGLGRKGQTFVATGPSLNDIGRFHQNPMEPIRIYAGVNNASDLTQRAQLILDEIKRTDGFSRDNLIIYTPSGTGWVNSAAVDSAEILLAGDVTSVAMQYSTVSSFLQYLIDKDIPGTATEILIEAILKEYSTLESPPTLYVYGESLGSLGSQYYFSRHPDDAYFSGGLWVGSPSGSPIWQDINSQTTERIWEQNQQPNDLYRFAPQPSEFDNQTDWAAPRFGFLFNRSDPVVWFGTEAIYQTPDTFKPPLSAELPHQLTWKPFFSYWQMMFELLGASSYESSYGHNYNDQIPEAWARILQPNN